MVGIACFAMIQARSGWFALDLMLLIVAYDLTHKRIGLAPILMAECRFLLYLTAASVGLNGITPRAFAFAVAIRMYVASSQLPGPRREPEGKFIGWFSAAAYCAGHFYRSFLDESCALQSPALTLHWLGENAARQQIPARHRFIAGRNRARGFDCDFDEFSATYCCLPGFIRCDLVLQNTFLPANEKRSSHHLPDSGAISF